MSAHSVARTTCVVEIEPPVPQWHAHAAAVPAKIALLGVGTVGRAVLARLDAWRGTAFGERLHLVHVANSRRRFALSSKDGRWHECVDTTSSQEEAVLALGASGVRIVIDATASDAIAACHATWLAQGVHVVTACKRGQGASLARWRDIQAAQRIGGTHYGDSATVGAGLPVLSSIRTLRAGGDRIHAIAGALSGSLAWLFGRYDGLRPFSDFVRQARAAGFTEPDPRDDLSGEDVRRKLLILARAAGVEIESDGVEVASLVPRALGALEANDLDAALPRLDEPLRARYAYAHKRGETLRFIARLEHGRARVGLESLPSDHPLGGGVGTDNRVAIWSDRYRERPLVIQGPGAGPELTAATLIQDALRIASGGHVSA